MRNYLLLAASFLLASCSPKLMPAPNYDRNVPDCVFMGNSITEIWHNTRESFFVGNNFVSVGIGGQTTAQMRERFADDVVSRSPKVVSIMGGINDIAQNQGYVSNEDIIKNIAAMAEMARKAKIKVILCSVLPADVIGWNPSVRPAALVKDLNERISNYARNHDMIYLDYYSRFVTASGGLPQELTVDGVHVTPQCYEQMEQMFVETITPLLGGK